MLNTGYQTNAGSSQEALKRATLTDFGTKTGLDTTLLPIQTSILSSNVDTNNSTAVKVPTTSLANRRVLTVRNNSDVTIYLGHSSVSSSNGLPLKANESIDLDLASTVDLYAISASGSGKELRILEMA